MYLVGVSVSLQCAQSWKKCILFPPGHASAELEAAQSGCVFFTGLSVLQIRHCQVSRDQLLTVCHRGEYSSHIGNFHLYVLTFVVTFLHVIGCGLSHFEGTVNFHCYLRCKQTTLYCFRVSVVQCCLMKSNNKNNVQKREGDTHLCDMQNVYFICNCRPCAKLEISLHLSWLQPLNIIESNSLFTSGKLQTSTLSFNMSSISSPDPLPTVTVFTPP